MNDLEELNEKYDRIEKKLDEMLHLLKGDIQQNTTKMKKHIDFVERIYENVKNPLGFICHRIQYIIGTRVNYDLEKAAITNDPSKDDLCEKSPAEIEIYEI